MKTKQELLKKMRKEAKINQAVLGKMIGVCRETIINIERGEPGAVNSMSLTNTAKWFDSCCVGGTSLKTIHEFQNYIAKQFHM